MPPVFSGKIVIIEVQFNGHTGCSVSLQGAGAEQLTKATGGTLIVKVLYWEYLFTKAIDCKQWLITPILATIPQAIQILRYCTLITRPTADTPLIT